MVMLGIDFGIKYIGLSLAEGPLAEPLATIENDKRVIERIYQICSHLGVKKIIIGISEGEMAKNTREFSEKMKHTIPLPILYQDETLTSQQVKKKLHEAKAKKKKRQGPDHAFAATEILQNFIDE